MGKNMVKNKCPYRQSGKCTHIRYEYSGKLPDCIYSNELKCPILQESASLVENLTMGAVRPLKQPIHTGSDIYNTSSGDKNDN